MKTIIMTEDLEPPRSGNSRSIHYCRNNIKKILICLLFFPIFVIFLSKPVVAFEDVPQNDEYFSAIEFLKEQEAINGYEDGKIFRPDFSITNGELFKVLISLDNSTEINTYKECQTENSIDLAYCIAVEKGYITGNESINSPSRVKSSINYVNKFLNTDVGNKIPLGVNCKDGKLTRGEAVEIIYRALEDVDKPSKNISELEECSIKMISPMSDNSCVDRYVISRGWSPYHKGIDFGAKYGVEGERGCWIVSVAQGVVEDAGYSKSIGNYVIIRHENNVKSLYGHLKIDSTLVSVGQEVKIGERIGYMGETGRATGRHLHFSVTLDGNDIVSRRYRVDPTKVIGGIS